MPQKLTYAGVRLRDETVSRTRRLRCIMADMPSPLERTAIPGASPSVLALREELTSRHMREVGRFEFGGRTVTVALGRDSLWAIVRRGRAGVAVRTAYSPSGLKARRMRKRKGESLRVRLDSAIGQHEVRFVTDENNLPLIRITTQLTPSEDLLIPHLPRDLYPLGPDDDPLNACGNVEAAQRGLNAGLLYWRLEGDTPGSMLYLQNLTAMNPYYNATKTRPDGAVGGEWPELGYLPPTPPQSGTPPVDALPKGEQFTISDAILVFQKGAPRDEARSAGMFLQMLGSAYRLLDKPEPQFHDWPARAEQTARDLADAPEATVRHYGNTYVHPYTASEYPDSMVQVITLSTLHDFGKWRGKPLPIEKKLAAGLGRFYDEKLRTLRRYLPNVGADKDPDAVDSWYLYHPLIGLGHLAIEGDKKARALFEDSIDYAIKAAHHFKYKWPIQYKVTDFSVIQAARDDAGLGQTDVGGFYAYLMLVAFELTDDARFLNEARKAVDVAQGMRFELNYQANLTAWGAAACMRLWRTTNEERYLHQSYVYLASFFHNSVLWNSDVGGACNYHTFMAVSCLHDGPYMALYECFDSFAAFERYLKDSGPELDPAVRLMVSDYCRFALDRAWSYYPDTLPEDMICEKPRNGHVDRKLSFPVEDLYVGGDKAGQVGQEIYGAGASFVFASRCYHRIGDAPFTVFCDHFIMASDRTSDRAISLQLAGDPASAARLSLIRTGTEELPEPKVRSAGGQACRRLARAADRIDFEVPASGLIHLSW